MTKHPDFNEEQSRLTYTKNYMEQLLSESKEDAKAAQENIRQSMADLDYLDSSLSYLNILTNARFFDMARTQKEGLEAIQKKPYFARIDFQKDDEERELLYIGKTSLFHRDTQEPIIVDWRSPVANVYYDGRLGDIEYDIRGELTSGHLFAKRQYTIEDGELIDLRDIDLTTNDELLQEALAGKADVRLTEIVSTIQKEQNEVIRAHLKQPIIVQGAAGSGKTTIALHRISYFLYTMGEHFSADNLMILAPSRLFIDYIGDVLPELGVGKIAQTTFAEYVQQAVGVKLKLVNPNDKLAMILRDQDGDPHAAWLSKMKGTLAYKKLIESYLTKYEEELAVLFEDIYIEKYKIMLGKSLRESFLENFAYMPIEKRLQRIKSIIQTDVNRKKKQIHSRLFKKYEDALEKALFRVRDDQKRKVSATRLIDERDERLPKIEKEAKSKTSSYMRRFKKISAKAMYENFLTDRAFIEEHADWTAEQIDFFINHHAKHKWELEDLAPLYFIHAKLKGVDEKWKVKVVFIDEAQDYSAFQFAALKEGLETDMFTIVGDLAQGIHSYRSFAEWQEVQNIFPRATFTLLQKSYRTTIEIMHVANLILEGMEEDLPLVEPVVRHGQEPTFHEMKDMDVETIHSLVTAIRSRGHRSVALICKTDVQAKKLSTSLEAILPVQLLTEDADLDQSKLLIVPSHLAKGLEFDAVIVSAINEPFRDTALERKLLYVAMTRPMHELHLVGASLDDFLLSEQKINGMLALA